MDPQPRPLLVLAGIAEIAEMLGVGRARADQLARQKGFPEPFAVLSAGRIWIKADVVQWMQERDERRRKT